MWSAHDAVLRSRSMYEEISFDRAQRTITEKVYTWPEAKTVKLSEPEYRELDAALSVLCLGIVTDAPPPPPGGPMDVTIESEHDAPRRLGTAGNTGGTFFVLTQAQTKSAFDALKKMSPEHRNCLSLDKSDTTITGDLLETKDDDGVAHPMVLLRSSVCVGPEPGVLAGSIEVVTGHQESIVAPSVKKRVVVTGKLSTKKTGDTTDVLMFVTSLHVL